MDIDLTGKVALIAGSSRGTDKGCGETKRGQASQSSKSNKNAKMRGLTPFAILCRVKKRARDSPLHLIFISMIEHDLRGDPKHQATGTSNLIVAAPIRTGHVSAYALINSLDFIVSKHTVSYRQMQRRCLQYIQQ